MRALSSSMSTEQAFITAEASRSSSSDSSRCSERRVLVVTLVGVLERAVQGGFEAL